MLEVGILLLAFVAGGIPFSNIFSRRIRGVDLRETESGTVSGTALYRVAGFPALAVSGLLDVGKGAVGPVLAGSDRPMLAGIAGGLAVVGHNWSPFLKGAGGRGLAPALGALLANVWAGALVLLIPLVVLRLMRQSGLGGLVGDALLVPVLALTNGSRGAIAGGAIALPMLVKRVLGNERPVDPSVPTYWHRLLYDCDPGMRTR